MFLFQRHPGTKPARQHAAAGWKRSLAKQLSGTRVRQLNSDAMTGQDYYWVFGDFVQVNGNILIGLIGTQILAKGLHLSNVTLVVRVSADTPLSPPDFRADERSFPDQPRGRSH